MTQQGYSLPEMLIALVISSVVMLGAARMLPTLQRENLRILMKVQLQEEMQLMMATLEKAVRRAGYCKGRCDGRGLQTDKAGQCLLIRWDENSNGRWEGTDSEESDYSGFRWRDGSLETQRGVNRCDSSGWDKLNDPATVAISDFRVFHQQRQIRLVLRGHVRLFPQQTLHVERWVTAVNL